MIKRQKNIYISPERWEKIKAGDEVERDLLVEQMLPLVKRVSTKIWRTLPAHVDLNDIVSYGNMGLLRAINNYDPTRGVHFETYAAICVRSVVLDELRAEDWAPRSLRRRQREVDAARERLIGTTGHQPTRVQISEELGWEESEVANVQFRTEASYHKSLDEGDPDRDWGSAEGMDPGDDQHTDCNRVHLAMQAVVDEIRQMPCLDQTVLALRYFKGMKLVQVGKMLGITEMKASQIHSRAVVRVQARLKNLLDEGTAL